MSKHESGFERAMKTALKNAEGKGDDFTPAEEYAHFNSGVRGQHAEKLRARLAAQRATGGSKVAAIRDYLDLLAPHNRIAPLLALIKSEPAAVFWPAFIDNWPYCDKGSTNRLLLKTLQRLGPCPASYRKYDSDRGEFFRSLPASITVYRGASRARIAGLSWTTDPIVAWRFCRGHRRITVPDPVIATGTISKSDIFWATDCRDEREILGEPRDIKVEDFQLEQLVAHVGWLVVDNVLHDRKVSVKDCAFVGLKGVHRLKIIRAHIMAVERIGYTPKLVRVGKVMEAPADLLYWRAVLAAVPKVKRRQPGFALIRIDRSKPLGLDNVAWSRWPEAGPQVHPVPTEAERKEWMAAIEQEERMRRPIIEAMKQALIDRDELDPMTEAMIDAGEWDEVDGYDD